jgi:hypothetical protein
MCRVDVEKMELTIVLFLSIDRHASQNKTFLFAIAATPDSGVASDTQFASTQLMKHQTYER